MIIERVKAALRERGMSCHPSSSLGRLFSKVLRLSKTSQTLSDGKWHQTFWEASQGVRIAQAVESALDDPAAKEAIKRVTASDMTLTQRQESKGKDALWELELYRRLRLAGAGVRFEEPDLVLSLHGFGDYAIACKKTYSEKNIRKNLDRAVGQLWARGTPGVIAFNIDDLVPKDTLLKRAESEGLGKALEDMLSLFLTSHKEAFGQAIATGICDAVIASLTVHSEVPSMSPPRNTSTRMAILEHGTNVIARSRARALVSVLDKRPA